jgi:anti-sigma factor RsiW
MNRERHVLELLSDYIDGCLSPLTARRVEAHLAACPSCAAELEQWRAVLRLVSRHAAVPCPIDCADAVLQRIEAATAPQTARAAGAATLRSISQAPSWAARVWLSAAAGLALLLGSWSWFYSARPEPAPIAQVSSPAAVPVAPVVQVDAPERLQGAFGRSDNLILASDFAVDP